MRSLGREFLGVNLQYVNLTDPPPSPPPHTHTQHTHMPNQEIAGGVSQGTHPSGISRFSCSAFSVTSLIDGLHINNSHYRLTCV